MRSPFTFFKTRTTEKALVNLQNIVLWVKELEIKPNQDKQIPNGHKLVPVAHNSDVKEGDNVVIWNGSARRLIDAYDKTISETKRRIMSEELFKSYQKVFIEFDENIGFFDHVTGNMNYLASECIRKSNCMETAIKLILRHCQERIPT